MSDGGAAGGGASGPEPRPSRTPPWLARLLGRQVTGAAVLGVAAFAFAAGLLTAAVIAIGPQVKTAEAQASSGGLWALFGKPRRPDAARPGPVRPEGFAI